MKNYRCSDRCPEEDYFSRTLCAPLGTMLGWGDCEATKQVLAQATIGNPAAEFLVASALEEWDGVVTRKSRMWYERSAQKGHQPAKIRLEEIATYDLLHPLDQFSHEHPLLYQLRWRYGFARLMVIKLLGWIRERLFGVTRKSDDRQS